VPSSDAVIALLVKRPEYIKMIACLEEPKIASEFISCVIERGVEVSPATIKSKLHTLERWDLVKTERVGKYVIVVAKKRVVEKVRKLEKDSKV